MTPVEVAVTVLLVGSVAFSLIAVIGFARLPDVFARAHAASKSETLGALFGLTAAAVGFGLGQGTLKIAMLAAFVLVTGPTAAHAIVRAASLSGATPETVEKPSSPRHTDRAGGDS